VLEIDGVIRQVVESAGAGIFVRPGDPGEMAQAIQGLALAPQKARQMGLAGRSYVEEHFSRAESAEKLAQLLENMGRKNA
jgi:glycosyltransferase involved in cell wall biosynthesis